MAGDSVTAAEYERRFGVNAAGWPVGGRDASDADSISPSHLEASRHRWEPRPGSVLPFDASVAYLKRLRGQTGPDASFGRPRWECLKACCEHSDNLDGTHHPDPDSGELLAQALTAIPRAGSEFLGFQLLTELGSGTFGRVYLSRQGALGDRLVVLKIVPRHFGESRTLARLQHAHIVPIYSVHETDDFQAICMPFLGKTTLA